MYVLIKKNIFINVKVCENWQQTFVLVTQGSEMFCPALLPAADVTGGKTNCCSWFKFLNYFWFKISERSTFLKPIWFLQGLVNIFQKAFLVNKTHCEVQQDFCCRGVPGKAGEGARCNLRYSSSQGTCSAPWEEQGQSCVVALAAAGWREASPGRDGDKALQCQPTRGAPWVTGCCWQYSDG